MARQLLVKDHVLAEEPEADINHNKYSAGGMITADRLLIGVDMEAQVMI
jgi:hypothetical protein